MMTIYEAMSLMLLFGTLLISLHAYIDRKTSENKNAYLCTWPSKVGVL